MGRVFEGIGELEGSELGVEGALLQQALVGTLFDDSAAVEDEDPVGRPDLAPLAAELERGWLRHLVAADPATGS